MGEGLGPSPEQMGLGKENKEVVKPEIDFEMYERSLFDGTADEYFKEAGALPAEALLEEQGDERVWSDLSSEEQAKIETMLSNYASRKGYQIEKHEGSCMVVAE